MSTRTRTTRAVTAALVLVGLLGTATSGDAQSARAATTSSTSPGCGSSSPGSTTLTPTINGVTRTVIVHVPKGSSNSRPLALVLNLHGSGSDALEQEGFTNMNASSNTNHFIVAYPQGVIPDGTGYDWNVPGVPLSGGRRVPASAANDVEFISSLVVLLEKKYCVDPREIYATGFSGGARMVSQLACDDANQIAAFAPVSGLRRPTPCPTTRPVPILSFHGSADPVDHYGGHGQAYWTYSVPEAAQYWAAQDHCSLTATTSRPHAGVTLRTYAHCGAGVEVELYELKGEGHEWPGGPTLPSSLTALLGPQSNAVYANRIMWKFFLAHPLPATKS